MNTEMARRHGHHYDEDFPQQEGVGLHSEGHEDEHRGKKSVIKKVKAKAKKIKDTLGLKIHGHEQEQEHKHDHDEEDDYDDDVEEDQEVHGEPTDEKVNSDQPRINSGQSSPFKEDPHSPKDRAGTTSPGNYQTKVTEPTGAGGEDEEAKVEPIIRSFGKIGFTDEPKPEHKLSSGTGSHDQDQFYPDSPSTGTDKTIPENPQPVPQSFGTTTKPDEHQPEDMNVDEEPRNNQSSCIEKDQFSPDSPSTGTNKTIPENPQSIPQSFDTTKPDDEHQPEDMNIVDEEPRNNQSSYTEKISYATSAIAGKAITAKNVVASKLGYGGKDDNEKPAEMMKKDGEGEQTKSSTAAVGEYGWQIASTVKEKLTPVYEKVAGAGSAVVTKVQGTVAGTGTGTGTEGELGGGGGGGKEQDKGISMKNYLVEKFSPGEEDKALSEVISGGLHKRKEEYPEEVGKSMDKVRESPEVARRLGTDDDHENIEGYGNGSGGGSGSPSGKGVVGRVKEVVSSWFGKGVVGDQIRPTEAESSRSPDSSSNVDEQEKVSGVEVGHEGSRPSTY